jgi:class 3 adenylate cyclase
METNHIAYDYLKSFERIDEIIQTSDSSFEELKEIPSRDKLTYTNGFYVYCSALFIDIRDSSALPEKHTRPKLAKLYRTYLSEVVAVMNGNDDCAEISIVGDCVSGVFKTPYTRDIDGVFSTAAELSSLVDVLNCKFEKQSITSITVGIGMSYGRALMIKAGYKGSAINDIVWMGNVLNEASNLCGYGNKGPYDRETMVSSVFYQNLNEHNQGLLEWNASRNCYHGNIVNIAMNEWYEEHRQS